MQATETHEGMYGFYGEAVLHLRAEYLAALKAFQERFPTPEQRGTQQEELLQQQMGMRLDTMMVATIMVTAAAVESLANYYLAIRLRKDDFNFLERTKLTEKWTT